MAVSFGMFLQDHVDHIASWPVQLHTELVDVLYEWGFKCDARAHFGDSLLPWHILVLPFKIESPPCGSLTQRRFPREDFVGAIKRLYIDKEC